MCEDFVQMYILPFSCADLYVTPSLVGHYSVTFSHEILDNVWELVCARPRRFILNRIVQKLSYIHIIKNIICCCVFIHC